MRWSARYLNRAVAAFLAVVALPVLAAAQDADIDTLLESLQYADAQTARQIEERIYGVWSQSGSDAMDLLLARGRDAMAEGDPKTAVEHLTALIDHAPDFAEGYNARATAFFQLGEYGASLEDIRRTLALNPRHFGAISGLALILEELGKPEAALAAWREAEKVNPQVEGLAEAVLRLEPMVDGRSI